MKNGNKSEAVNLHQMEVDNQINNLKVLIVDDLIIEWKILAQKLLPKEEGIVWKNVLYAENGIEAVETCRSNPDIDLILMNIQMPNMDGYEATRQIRNFNKEVIIIVQTEASLEYVVKKAEEAGWDDYIRKPIDLTLLHEILIENFIK